ncbi:MAG TPA: efflux RND transporter periplasmic adaptor subunit [Thermoanaerobaculia bacterium]|jgi:membrane fusion protein (multidrug efflux system)|nr:efflux RND transporter periplasmic adaptor subunit [Thermoanaerobaculia bacterium]
MKRLPISILSLSVLLLPAFACGGKPKAAKPDASAEAAPAPGLPADVEKIAGIAPTSDADGSGAAPSPANPANPSATAATDPATGAPPPATVEATGELVSPVQSELAVRMPGRVGKMYVDEGARVRKGQPLLTLETQYLALEVERSTAEVARAAAAAGDAKRDLERKRDLLAKGSVAQAAFDRSESAASGADAAVLAAKATRDLARQRLEDAVLRSPIDGVVAEKRTDVGERMGEATIAFVIVQTSPLKLRFRLPERYLASVKIGQEVEASVDPYPGETFRGRVKTIGGVVESATRTVAVETEFANGDGRLKPGLFARVKLDLGASTPGGAR